MSVTPFPASGSRYAAVPLPEQPWSAGAAALGDSIRALALTLMGQTSLLSADEQSRDASATRDASASHDETAPRDATASHDETASRVETWRTHFQGLLRPLRAAFAEHRAVTEGDEGFYAEVVQDAPRLARAVDGLVAEHRYIDIAIARLAHIADEVSSDADALRRRALNVLDDLALHRQHDADLVYEAYETDIGGE